MPEVEEFRDVPALPKKVIETTSGIHWIHPFTSQPLDDEQAKRVVFNGGDAYLGGGDHLMRLRDQGMFERIVYLAPRRGERATSLMDAMIVPGLSADDSPGWGELRDAATPHTVLAYLDGLEGAPASDRADRRIRQVEFVRV